MKVTIKTGDFFCGAGGGTSGLLEACEELGIEVEVDAVNHWDTAIKTHSINHPNVRHWCENLDSVWPRKIVPSAHLHFAVFAPECTHHARARGAKPMNAQSRATAWCVIRWAEEINIENILVENVPEFMQWGPLYPDDYPDEKKRGRPIPEKKGLFFKNWIKQLKIRSYKVDYRVLNSAFFGAATARKRFFLQARKKGRITWPEPTHEPKPEQQSSLFGQKPKFVPARNIIDWSLQGESIYNRDRPLAENTMNRIYAGIKKFSGLPFIVPNFGERDGQVPRTHSIDTPLPSVTGVGAGNLVQLFLVVLRNNCDARSLEEPTPTICAGGEHIGLCEPFLMKYHGSHKGRGDGAQRVYPLDEPIKTLDTQPRFAVIEPYLISLEHSTEDRGHARRCLPVTSPLPTVTSRGAADVNEPLPTITTKDRFALVDPQFVEYVADKGEVIGVLDILFRMLQPHELGAAMGFRKSYSFCGNREDQIRQIGNAIEVNTMKALCKEMLKSYAPRRKNRKQR
ncbi:MAG TPA: DNA cytosine methyltransferase [Abditibacteriaceae bacterium]